MAEKVFRGDRLRQVRESHGLSQLDLATRTGVHLNQIGRYENGVAEPLPHQIRRIAIELQVTTDYLLGLVDQRNGRLAEPELTADERQFIAALRQGKLRTLLRLIQQAVPDEEEQPGVPGVGVAADSDALDGVPRPVAR
jgi:transcriptional regulator with XRE-family HTH domain